MQSTTLQTVPMHKQIKPHLFCHLYLQVRGKEMSLDVNEQPVFTSITLRSCSGDVGVASKANTSMVFKNFKFNRTHPSQETAPPHAPSTGSDVLPPAPPLPSTTTTSLGDPQLVQQIESDLIQSEHQPTVQYDQIAGHEDAKRLLQEALIMPMLVPELFQGIREPWRGVLLFGPPGTGKTMLAKATAAVAGISFFNTSAASLVSKYRGESEKLVKTLFAVARHWSPSVIFMDEIDALVKSRGGEGEHESSRRFKSEFLTQMDGMTSRVGNENVVVLATTNKPWDLDTALLRRLEKRIHVPLPNAATRTQLFNMLLKDLQVDELVLYPLVKRTEYYSGADIRMLVREAAMGPMRRLLLGKTTADIGKMRVEGELNPDKFVVSLIDFVHAFKKTNSSIDVGGLSKFESWAHSYGSQ